MGKGNRTTEEWCTMVSHENVPHSTEPGSFPLVGESTAVTKALSCLKLRSCLSSFERSTVVDPNGELPRVESGVLAEDRKNRKNRLGDVGVRDSDRAQEAAARGVASLFTLRRIGEKDR